MPLRLIFMGTPDFAVPTLLELLAHGHEIAAVYTRAAKPGGRGMKLQPTPVEQEARRLGIPVFTPRTLKTTEAEAEFRALAADAAIVVAYGMILPQAILDAPESGCYNLHASLLPRWRGAAPIERAIMAGDTETGVMVMKMDAGLDTGDVAMAERVAITDRMTANDLHDVFAPLGADLMARAMGALEKGALQLTNTATKTSPTPPRSRRPRRVSTGANRPALCCGIFTGCRRFRARGARSAALAKRRGSRFCVVNSHAVPARRAPCLTIGSRLHAQDGAFRIIELQRAGKAPMKAAEFLRGTPLKVGAKFA